MSLVGLLTSIGFNSECSESSESSESIDFNSECSESSESSESIDFNSDLKSI